MIVSEKTGRQSTGNGGWDRLFKVSTALAGLLLCLQVLSESPEEAGAVRFTNEAVEEIRLGSEDGFEVLWETSLDRKWLYRSDNFSEWFDNKHIWVHWQTIQLGDLMGSIHYFEFRGHEDAREAKEKLKRIANVGWKQEAEVFGSFVVLVGGLPTDFPAFKKAVFAALAKRSEPVTQTNSL